LPKFCGFAYRRFEIMATEAAITIPDGYTLHTENTSHILLPSTNEAFLNPIQEFNRDVSVACITTWSEELDKVKEAKWQSRRSKKTTDVKRLKSECAAAILHFCILINRNYLLANNSVPVTPSSTAESSVEHDVSGRPEDLVPNVDLSTAETTQPSTQNEVYSILPVFI
jgi:tRNA (guanine26-N2/guanine27-N2)-dimethyltransferase